MEAAIRSHFCRDEMQGCRYAERTDLVQPYGHHTANSSGLCRLLAQLVNGVFAECKKIVACTNTLWNIEPKTGERALALRVRNGTHATDALTPAENFPSLFVKEYLW